MRDDLFELALAGREGGLCDCDPDISLVPAKEFR